MPDDDRAPGARAAPADDAAAARRRALSATAGRDAARQGGFARRVRPEERRRYAFQVWTTAAFAAAWLLVFVLTGSWLFLVLAGGFAALTILALVALRTVGRPGD